MTDTLDTRGAAELLHVSEAYVQQLARSGKIPGVQLGNNWLFIRQDLLDCLRAMAAEEQRKRREQTELAADQPKPIRRRGRPRKIEISGQNSGYPL
jgi:excisionase family DNA binding protein